MKIKKSVKALIVRDDHFFRLRRNPSPQTVFLSANTDKKDVKERYPMMGALKNHRDERVTISVEELVPQDHFLRAIEATIDFHFIEEKLRP